MLRDDTWLRRMILIRILMYANFMVYAACIPALMPMWDMSAVQAGSIVSGFMAGYATSLFVCSRLADRFGARRVFWWSICASAVTALMFGFGARSYGSALVLYTLAASTQGGMYTPALMMFSDRYVPARRGSAIGYLIASTSIGYAFSLVISGTFLAWRGYEAAFMVTGCLPTFGALICARALRDTENKIHPRRDDFSLVRLLRSKSNARWLIAGYVSHSWELLGMWAWTPTFFAAAVALAGAGHIDVVSGAYLTAAMHVVGSFASMTMGTLSDRLGRRLVLIFVAACGAVMSFVIGWLITIPITLLTLIGLLYYYTAIGDSAVLSTAISEAVPPGHLGSVLALRALLGFGAGAASPVVFGWVLDVVGATHGAAVQWGWAFASLGLGGLLATWYGWRYRDMPRTGS